MQMANVVITGAARNKKRGGLNFFVMITAYANLNFSFRQIVTNYKDLATTGRSPAVVHAADA